MRRAWLRRLALPLAFALLAALPAGAQEDRDALIGEMAALMNEAGRGFNASQAVLARSFASWLHAEDGPRTVAELSAMRAAYDPKAPGNRLTAGMLHFHLARPIEIFRALGGGPDEVFARIMEIRLRWLSGNAELALAQAEELIALMDAPDAGWSDPEMVSLLADAAVLSWRAGRRAQAETYFARALACDARRCPDDLVFGWLGETRKPSRERFEAYDAEALAAVALAAAPDLFPGDARVAGDIRLEAALMQGDIAPLRDLLRRAEAGALMPGDRALAGILAGRVQGTLGIAGLQMGDNSLGAQYRMAARIRARGGDFDPDPPGGSGYFSTDSFYSGLLYRALPVLHDLLRLSDRRGDDILAELIRLRLIIMAGDHERALPELLALADGARARGFDDEALFSVLMDAWGLAQLTGRTALAEDLARATAGCRAAPCDGDLALRFLVDWDGVAPLMPTLYSYRALARDRAEIFLRETFPGDLLKLADLYETGIGGASDRPMDAAQDDLLSISYAEAAPDIALDDLAGRAAGVMNTLIYAGRYADAAALGDRILARLRDAGAETAAGRAFFQHRARAAFHLGDDAARGFYETTVERALAGTDRVPESLVLDLFDTTYDDLLTRLLARVEGYAGIRARLRYRAGAPGAAAQILADNRHAIARRALGDDMAAYYTAQAEHHLRAGSLDAYLAAITAARRAAEGDFPPEHAHIYARYWDLRLMAYQEAVYRAAAGDVSEARRLRALGGREPRMAADWVALSAADTEERLRALERLARQPGRGFSPQSSSYDMVRDIIEWRDQGYFEAGAEAMIGYRWVALAAEENGAYIDAQALWQMAFTFLRGGEARIAFDLMDRAARIAARLSFEGAGGADGGTLQLLERDRWRYLLFVDIAWAAVTGEAPEAMLVVSRY